MSKTGQICFTDNAGKSLFSIPDGGFLRLSYGNGDEHFALCRRLEQNQPPPCISGGGGQEKQED